MLSKIFLLGILGIGVIYVISILPKKIASVLAEFLVIAGIIAFLLAIILFGFKPIREKLWWENV
jgi:TRAP-type C4-dicarboxylate transport system permease small subunit